MLLKSTTLLLFFLFSSSAFAGSQLARFCDADTAHLKKKHQEQHLQCKQKFKQWENCVDRVWVFKCSHHSKPLKDCYEQAHESRKTWSFARRSCFTNGRKAQREALNLISKKKLDPTTARLLSFARQYNSTTSAISKLSNSQARFDDRISSVRVLALKAQQHFSGGSPSFAWLLSGKLLSESTQHLVGIASYANFEFQSAIAEFDQWHYKSKYQPASTPNRNNLASHNNGSSTTGNSNTVDWLSIINGAATAVTTYGMIQQVNRQNRRTRSTTSYSSSSRPRSSYPSSNGLGDGRITDSAPGGYRGQGIP